MRRITVDVNVKGVGKMSGATEFRSGVPFLGGALWIDLLNTTPVMAGQRLDLVGDAARLKAWTALAGLGGEAAVSEAEVSDVHSLRENLRGVFDDLAAGLPVIQPVVEAVNAVLQKVTVTRVLEMVDGVPRVVEQERVATGPVAATVALDFARFMADHDPTRLKHCQNPACTMVFYDQGKNNRRRWCSTSVCGNRDKVANYRARKAAKAG